MTTTKPLPSPSELKRAADSQQGSLNSLREADRKLPALEDLKADPVIGKALKVTRENEDGSWEGTFSDDSPDKAVAKRYLAMLDGWRQADYWNGQQAQNQPEMADVHAAADERGRKRRGERPRIYWGRPKYRVRYDSQGVRHEERL